MFTLHFTESEWKTIRFVGGRYSWSEALLAFDGEIAEFELSHEQANDIATAIESDTEGGHEYLPMLSGGSALYSKIMKFYYSVVV